MNRNATGEEIFSVFDEALPVIHATLVSFYRFMEEEAEAFEDTLLVWFERMARRNASQKTPVSELDGAGPDARRSRCEAPKQVLSKSPIRSPELGSPLNSRVSQARTSLDDIAHGSVRLLAIR